MPRWITFESPTGRQSFLPDAVVRIEEVVGHRRPEGMPDGVAALLTLTSNGAVTYQTVGFGEWPAIRAAIGLGEPNTTETNL